jgi:Ni,Fe-hydrogenase III large subunit
MTHLDGLIAILRRTGQPATPDAAWPRVRLDEDGWWRLRAGFTGGGLDLVALWGEAEAVHAAVREGEDAAIFTLGCGADGAYPALGQMHPPAIRLERAMQDLVGLRPQGLPDQRAWLDHGRWPTRHPLGVVRPACGVAPYEFLPVEGEGLHQVPVGPVHAGTIEPGHFRFTVNGETVVRLEARLGYAHKGTMRLMIGAPLATAARLAGRISGDSTVAYAYAFALAVEIAANQVAPVRAQWLRALMAELERLANHLGDIGAICNDAAFAILHAHCGILREQVLRACHVAFGHRLMMDGIVPGGVSADIGAGGLEALLQVVAVIRKALPRLVEVYDETNSLQDRTVGTGVVRPEWVQQFAAGGFVGRACGRGFDARKWRPYELYRDLAFEAPVLTQGDVNARVWVRIREVEQSLSLLDQLLAEVPPWPFKSHLDPTPPTPLAEGAALVEGFRGDIFLWVRLNSDGGVAACHFRDPSWFQWPLLEAAIEGNILADFPLCNKSFNCAYSGHDG